MEFSFVQEIYFSNKNSLLVTDVANSLLSMAKVSKLTPLVFERMFEGTTVRDLQVYIDNIESGSLKEKIKYYFSISIQKKIDDINSSEADTILLGDASCMMHIQCGLYKQGFTKKVKHFADVLAESITNENPI